MVIGDNGQGKTNLVEALAYLATLSSFRGVPNDAHGAHRRRHGDHPSRVVRHDDDREMLVEAEIAVAGRNRVQVNRQRLVRSRDLLGTLRITVFSPDDLILVKGSPGDRRRFLDDTLVALATKYDATRLELDRIVRQRNTLLKQAAGRLTDEIEVTLDVWDAKFATIADQFGHARATLVARLAPMVTEAYEQLAGDGGADRDGVRAAVAVDRAGRGPRASRAIDGHPARRVDRRTTSRRTRAVDHGAARAGRRRRRASSVRWRSRCDWPRTGW